MAVSDGETITVVKDMGLVTNVFDERNTRRRSTGPSRHRPHPLLHHRLEHVAQRPAGLPRRRRRTASRSATTATWSTPRSWPPRPGMLPARSPATATSWPSSSQHASCAAGPRRAQRRPGPRAGADGGAAQSSRARSRSSSWTTPTSSACAIPTASGRFASAGSTTGWVLASETPALDIVGARFVRELEPGEMVVIDASGARSLHPFARRAGQPEALPLRVRLLRPTRQPPLRPERAQRPSCAWASSWPTRRRSRPTW